MKYTIIVCFIMLFACSKEKEKDKQDSQKVAFSNTITSSDLEYSLLERASIDFKSSIRKDSIINLASLATFDIDDEGNIYILDFFNSTVNKYNKKGKLFSSFEKNLKRFQKQLSPSSLFIYKDTLYVASSVQKTIYTLDFMGNYLKSKKFKNSLPFYISKIGDNYVGLIDDVNQLEKHKRRFQLVLCDNNMEIIKILYKYELKDHDFYNNILNMFTPFDSDDSLIYVSVNKDNQYKINIYNQDGKKMGKIQKDYQTIAFSKEEKNTILQNSNLKSNNMLKSMNHYKKPIIYLSATEKYLWSFCSIDNLKSPPDFVVVDLFKNNIFRGRINLPELETSPIYDVSNLQYKIKNNFIYQFSNLQGKITIFEFQENSKLIK